MKAHIIENNKVVNTIEVESLDFMPNLIDGSIGSIGWDYIDGQLIEPVIPKTIPQTITPRQLRLALLQATLLDEVEAMVASDRAMGIWWEYSLDIERNNEYVLSAATALGLSETQVDDLFILAATL